MSSVDKPLREAYPFRELQAPATAVQVFIHLSLQWQPTEGP